MKERDTVNAWLRGLWSPEAEFTLDEVGSCAMSIDEFTACFIEVPEGEGRVRFFSPVVPLPEGDDTEEQHWLFSKLLEMNLPGGLSSGGALSIDYSLEAVVLRLDRSLLDMDGIAFANVFGGVVETVRKIRQDLYGLDGSEEAGTNQKGLGNIPGLQPNWIQV